MYDMVELAKSKGKAILISGDEGCGKSTLARQLAKDYGSFTEININSINNGFCSWMIDDPGTVIIDGEIKPEHVDVLARLVTSEKMVIDQKGRNLATVKTPNFILTCLFIPVVIRRYSRRFLFIEMGR